MNPNEDLYIYVMRGRVTEADETCFDDGFIGNWVEGNNSFLFFSRSAGDDLARLAAVRPDLELDDTYTFSYEWWQGGGSEPVRIDPFLIVPPWVSAEPEQGLTQILLDPGVVFGNGLHPTTRDCLSALAWCRRERPFEKVLDIGTGTGLLALAAAFMGARSVTAVDLNPLCVKTARKNVSLNGLSDTIRVEEGRAEEFSCEPADLVIANIHLEVIQVLLGEDGFRKRDRLILSGLMRSQAREVKVVLAKLGYGLVREWDHEMTWYTLLAQRM